MLPVNENYLTLNLAAQKQADSSHYKNVQALLKLRNSTVIREGSLDIQAIDDTVVAFARELEGEAPIVVLVNWDNTAVAISLENFQNLPDNLEVLVADVFSGIVVGDVYKKMQVELPRNAAVVLKGVLNTDRRH